MHSELTFLDCPAFMDAGGATRCGLPAEVEYEYTMSSTGGTLDSAKIRCPRGHWFNGPIEALTLDTSRDEGRGQSRDEDQVGDGDSSAARQPGHQGLRRP